jgi:hypothetical protein
MEKEKEVPVINIESPIKKIVIVGIVMVIFIAIIDFLSNSLQSNAIFQNKYILYSIVGVLLIGVFIFVGIFLRKKNYSDFSEKGNISKGDTKRVLKIIDNLLEKLPEKELKKFSKTKDAELYKSVLKGYGVK